MITTETVKKTIKKKFGSLTKFSKLTKLNRYTDLQKLFAAAEKNMTKERKDRLKELLELARKTPNKPVGSEITPEIREALRAKINEWGGVIEFCEHFPEFSQFSVWHILNGTRKNITPNVKKLLKVTNVSIE